MASRIETRYGKQAPQVKWEDRYIRYYRQNPLEYDLFCPLIAKGNIYEGIEAKT